MLSHTNNVKWILCSFYARFVWECPISKSNGLVTKWALLQWTWRMFIALLKLYLTRYLKNTNSWLSDGNRFFLSHDWPTSKQFVIQIIKFESLYCSIWNHSWNIAVEMAILSLLLSKHVLHTHHPESYYEGYTWIHTLIFKYD